MAGIGADGVVTDSTKQGGLAAAYYFGGIWGCFSGGQSPKLEQHVSESNSITQAGSETESVANAVS